jgi:hypothetical protein
MFFIETATGQVSTHRQLLEAGIATAERPPQLPWHRIQGPGDASTMWYAVLRKRERGVYIGTLTIRHGAHHASLLEAGWEEVPIEAIVAPSG